MDLTARAVSLITLTQDTFLRVAAVNKELTEKKPPVVFGEEFEERFKAAITELKAFEKKCREQFDFDTSDEKKGLDFESKMFDLVWYSSQHVPEGDNNTKQRAEAFLVTLCTNLSGWIVRHEKAIRQHIEKKHPEAASAVTENSLVLPPYVWFHAISEILYCHRSERVLLAQKLEYIPIHLVLAMGGGTYEAHEQRVLQWWQPHSNHEPLLLTPAERTLHQNFKVKVVAAANNEAGSSTPETAGNDYENRIIYLLTHYDQLTGALLANNAPLSFEYVFTEELKEVSEAREKRRKEPLLVRFAQEENEKQTSSGSCDPLVKAKEMELCALALSGGGIRSATFNLGLLQGLARHGFISKIDYLSTVSGGGYIGSWLATWIKREGSVAKVAERLNPNLSADPMGEEVRPIRWLRMFSNHFAPDKSIMSVDSWTIGATWLRNTLLNQLVIFLLLMAVLFLLRVLFDLWRLGDFWLATAVPFWSYLVSCLLLAGVAYFAGISMQWYNRESFTRLPLSANSEGLTQKLQYLTYSGAFIVSATLYFHYRQGFYGKLAALLPAGVVLAGVLTLIAAYGRYDKCITAFGISQRRANAMIVYTAILSAMVGCLSLMGVWKVMELAASATYTDAGGRVIIYGPALCFTVGLPLVLMAFGITVVARMALLGKYFPDERREWWGRMGAAINRFGFAWLLVAASCFLLRDVIQQFLDGWKAPATVGGWMALIGGAVRAAFSAKTSGKDEKGGWQTAAMGVLSKAGPYLFILGLLIFLPALIDPLLKRTPLIRELPVADIVKSLLFAVVLFVLGRALSARLGVNEFSMHHFYRNRLVRAYLGATRRKAAREKTANPYTHFDKLDDAKLAKFQNNQGYFGPFPLLNTALNASQSSDTSRQDRKAESFVFTPLYCGFDFSKVRSSLNTLNKTYDYGFRPTKKFAYGNDNGPAIGTAMAISGAAVNPNQGYHSAAGTAFLLTVFNVQMGWWIGNPRKNKWAQSDPDTGLSYLVSNLTGNTSTKSEFVNLSDGGHFDNMGLYELVRRRCSLIILGDAEQDENFTCEGLANAIRRCRIDFGAEISINIENIVNRKEGHSRQHFAVGDITYSGDEKPSGKLIYIKSSITGEEPVDIAEYALKNKSFPHQSTADQFFDEEQFESYRKLGMHIMDEAFQNDEILQALRTKGRGPVAGKQLSENIEEQLRLFKLVKEFFKKG